MDPNSKFGELLEKGQNITGSTVSDVTSALKGQVIGDKKAGNTSQQSNSVQQPANSEPTANGADYAKEVVGDLYAPSETIPQSNTSNSPQNDQTNLSKIRKELQDLHTQVYYKPLFAYEEKNPEKSVAERIEEEDQQKMTELQQEESKKVPPLSVQRAQTSTEINRGVSG